MIQITLKHLFFLILGLNILVTLFFWNISRQPAQQHQDQFQSIDLSEVSSPKKSLAHIYAGTDNPNTPARGEKISVGQFLKTSGSDSYLDDGGADKNYGDVKRAFTDLKSANRLQDMGIKLLKNTYTKLEVAEVLSQMQQKFQKQIKDLKIQSKDDLTKVFNQYKTLNTSVHQLRGELELANPFRFYGLYTYMMDELFNAHPNSKPRYDQAYYGVQTDYNYCDLVDLYNLYHPENVYEAMNFVVDYTEASLVRSLVVKRIGNDAMPGVSMIMEDQYDPRLPLNINATMFYSKRINLHHFWEISKNFACLTQAYGHIPGHGVLTRKDLNVKSVNDYAKRYKDKPQCFNQNMFFPAAYRFDIKEECQEFFGIINKEGWGAIRETEPLPYIIKIGHSAHRASGLFLFNQTEEDWVRETYENGKKCGEVPNSLLAQKYVSNPLLLDKENKFDFRIYMLVASVNPLIVYYHDGFLRLSLQKYDKFSQEINVHFTNTHLSKELFELAKEQKEYRGMTEAELREYQMWSMEDLSEHLNEIGKVNDTDWLDNYLRPTFQKAFIHTVRMSEHSFLKHSGMWEMFGLDFLLDDNLNLWFIECNASPQLIGTSDEKTKFLVRMLTDMFEIQYAYLRSRFKRIQEFMSSLHNQVSSRRKIDRREIRNQFAIINRNKLEPQFKISENNSFTLIMDKSLSGADAYFGHVTQECIDD
jgi:tubulin polyglutamylase TTLL1